MTDQGMKYRFAFSMVLLMVAMTGLGVRLAFLHVGRGQNVREEAEKSRSLERKIPPGRGIICDCRGDQNILAINLFVKDVCANPSVVVKSDMVSRVASQVAESLNLPADEIAVRLKQPDKKFAFLKRYVLPEKARELEEQKLEGVFFTDTMTRYYPHGMFLCHVLGFVNYDGYGSAGVEQLMDKYLRGSDGYVQGRVDALRRELYVHRSRYMPALEGANVVLTIDQNLQYVVEKTIEAAMVEHHAKGVWAIVERVRTGEILAMASRPAFDLNEFTAADDNVKLNRAIGFTYEPGSTFKPVVIAAALNERTVTPDTVLNCENGKWMHNNHILRDFHPYGNLTVADGVKKSSNILTAKVALTLGDKRLRQYLTAFGIGKKTQIDLPGEETGILHELSDWSKISASRIAIGQGVSVTGLQMVNMICAIANDGYLMRPYLVSQVTRNNGSVIINTKPEVLSRPISSETAAIMRKLLRRVTEDGGTGCKARVDGYEVAGKTGTAQKAVAGGYSSSAYTASFLGFLPADNPEIALVVVVDEPQPVHLGGTVAAPVFAKIASHAVRCLDIPPGGIQTGRRDIIAAYKGSASIGKLITEEAGD
jgi:cell division protein FtsI (penicillin-binding protein 3)